ncbi:SRPBCC domain-containing protein [Cytobacillus sp. IB215665]|uniref:SRPBCC family protein n=1 Tax=Cytobacillus sp. IB215665 TaxID=3097357 RepID=UPI002A12298D|nr:SRPBCC domain-containing protein [Cytobacillus sp. IB215665]MDX8365536.1 SRPBCC domain-containing protein [Cytobacillus sp. IB215665]
MTPSVNSSLIINVTINSPIDLVWHAWTISDRVSKWFAPKAVIELKKGGAFELYFESMNIECMNTKGCKIKRFVPKQQLEFTWKGPDQFASIMNNQDDLTLVNVLFEKEDKKTSVIIEHFGWGYGKYWQEAYKWHEKAWQDFLGSLKFALEKGKGELWCQPE